MERAEESVTRWLLALGRWPGLLAVVLLAHGLGALNELVWDDLVLWSDPRVAEARWGELLATPYWRDWSGGGLWRPLVLLSLGLERALHGSVALAHVTNLALHVAAAVALRRALASLVGPVGAAAAALLFATHPVHVDAVVWLVGRAELGALALGLVAWELTRRAAQEGWRPRAALGCGLAALGALLCKESAVALGPAALLHAWVVARAAAPQAPLRRALVAAAPFAAAALVALGLRLAVLPALTPGGAMTIPPLLNPLAAEPLLVRAANAPVLAARYAWLCVAPWHLAPERGAPAIPVAPGPLAPIVLAALAGWGGAAAAAWRAWRAGEPLPALALGWFLLLLGPVLQLVPIGVHLAERLAYAPSLAWCALAGGWAARARRGPVIVLVVAALFTARAAVHTRLHRDALTLFAAAAAAEPRSANAQLLHAQALMSHQRWADALAPLGRAAPLAPGYLPVPWRQAVCLLNLGRPLEAEAALRRCEVLDPRDPDVLRAQAQCALLLGRPDEARGRLVRLRALGDPAAWDAAATALRAMGHGPLVDEVARGP